MTGGTEINKAAIARCDPSVSQIVETASQVALYKYEGESWEKTDIEGCLFIYERSARPRFSFVIKNRHNPGDYIEPITQDLEINADPPYLFYRKHSETEAQSVIHGLWFFNRTECEKIAQSLRKLVQLDLNEKEESSASVQAPPVFAQGKSAFKQVSKNQFGEGDIMTMLSKAQSDYVKGAGKSQEVVQGTKPSSANVGNHKVIRPKPVRTTPVCRILQRGEALPAAKKEEVLSALFASSASISDPSNTKRAEENEQHGARMPDMLQRLLSCPTGEFDGAGGNLETAERKSVEEVEKHLREQGSDEVPVAIGGLIPPAEFENSMSSIKNESSFIFELDNPAFNSTPAKKPSAENDSWMDDFGSSFCDSQGLLTPADVTSGSLKQRPASCTKLERNGYYRKTEYDSVQDITPLTKEQMLQALTYMLQNDPGFVSKLHENYVKSLNDGLAHKRGLDGSFSRKNPEKRFLSGKYTSTK